MTAGEPGRALTVSAAGALFFDQVDRVMLVRPTYKLGWDIPGGYVEAGESPLSACRREINEELGIAPPIHRLLVVGWAPHPVDGDKVLYVFDGGTLSADDLARVRLPADELAEYRYHAADELDAALAPRSARRVRGAIEARSLGQTLYLEHGTRPASASERPSGHPGDEAPTH